MSARKDWQVVFARNGLELVRYADGRRELRLSDAPEVTLSVQETGSAEDAAMLAAVWDDESRTN